MTAVVARDHHSTPAPRRCAFRSHFRRRRRPHCRCRCREIGDGGSRRSLLRAKPGCAGDARARKGGELDFLERGRAGPGVRAAPAAAPAAGCCMPSFGRSSLRRRCLFVCRHSAPTCAGAAPSCCGLMPRSFPEHVCGANRQLLRADNRTKGY
jgi:hypothetical protein